MSDQNKTLLSDEEIGRLKISTAWANFILYCQKVVPYGDIKIRIVNGEPRDLLSTDRKIKFDQPQTLPSWPESQGLSI